MNTISHNGHELVTCRNKNTAKILNHVSILYVTAILSCLCILFRSNQTLNISVHENIMGRCNLHLHMLKISYIRINTISKDLKKY